MLVDMKHLEQTDKIHKGGNPFSQDSREVYL